MKPSHRKRSHRRPRSRSHSTMKKPASGGTGTQTAALGFSSPKPVLPMPPSEALKRSEIPAKMVKEVADDVKSFSKEIESKTSYWIVTLETALQMFQRLESEENHSVPKEGLPYVV